MFGSFNCDYFGSHLTKKTSIHYLCKMSTSCCFHIPDYSENVTNIITHVRMAVKEPERANNVWSEWLADLWGGWGYWLCNTVLPIVAEGLLLLHLPCIFVCIQLSTETGEIKVAVNP